MRPPTTIAMKMPEPIGTYLPRPSAAMLKMPPHITDVMRPQSAMKHMASGNWIPKRLIIFNGVYIVASINAIPSTEHTVICAREETFAPTAPPSRRPIIMQNQ